MHPTQLEVGDVLLCRGQKDGTSLGAYVRGEIAAASASVYTHAAICVGTGRVLDARVGQGVTIRRVVELLAESTYVAVLRQPLWRQSGAQAALQSFAERLSSKRVKYNKRRFWRFLLKPSRDKQLLWEREVAANQGTVFEKLEKFFESGEHPLDGRVEEYFCSELVVHAFERCGIVGRAVLIPNNPSYIAPGDLARDATYGYPVGYMAKGSAFEIPSDDPLVSHQTLWEIFSRS